MGHPGHAGVLQQDFFPGLEVIYDVIKSRYHDHPIFIETRMLALEVLPSD